MTEIFLNIKKSTTPIIWIDTSIISNMAILKNNPNQLDRIQYQRNEQLYNQIVEYSRIGKVICPAAEQEGEVWINRNQWLDVINMLSFGVNCVDYKSIQDCQLRKGMEGYLKKSESLDFSYLDIFRDDPVEEINNILHEPFYVTLNRGILFGADYNRQKKKELHTMLNKQRAINVKNKVSYDSQLKDEFVGEINQVLYTLQNQSFQNSNDIGFRNLWASSELTERLDDWQYLGGDKENMNDFLLFYKSKYHELLPIIDLSCSLFAKIMTDPQAIKTGDPKDIHHISSIMPFCDLFITDKSWSTFLNKKGFSKKYNTTVCYIGDTKIINNFFRGLNS